MVERVAWLPAGCLCIGRILRVVASIDECCFFHPTFRQRTNSRAPVMVSTTDKPRPAEVCGTFAYAKRLLQSWSQKIASKPWINNRDLVYARE